MRKPALRPERAERWRRSDDHHRASGGSRVKADAGAAGGFARLDARAPEQPHHPSDRRPGLPLNQRSPTRRSAASTTSRVPLRRKRPAGTQGDGDIDEPSAVTERARSTDDHAASEIDAPGPPLTPTCGGHLRRPRTEEWTLPDNYPRSRCQLGALDPRSPITEEGLTTVPPSAIQLAFLSLSERQSACTYRFTDNRNCSTALSHAAPQRLPRPPSQRRPQSQEPSGLAAAPDTPIWRLSNSCSARPDANEIARRELGARSCRRSPPPSARPLALRAREARSAQVIAAPRRVGSLCANGALNLGRTSSTVRAAGRERCAMPERSPL